jgi:hypothetical protein
MVKSKKPGTVRILLPLVLFPCVLFGALAEFAGDIREFDFPPSAVLAGKTSESGGTTLFISESLLFRSQMPAQNRGPSNKLWRQFFSLIVLALLLTACGRIILLKHYLHNHFPRKFFHILVISLLLGGRAPPSSVC